MPTEESEVAILDYASPPPRPQRAWERVGLGFAFAVLHYVIGLTAIAIFNVTSLINIVAILFLFPIGLVATIINPHRTVVNAMVNSLFCGLVLSYTLSFYRHRRRP
jgi:hypothetical protein